jgi:V-type H+-transporting ATPase subunit H
MIQSPSANKRDVAVQCLEALLARHDCRQAVYVTPGLVAGYVQ